MTYFGTSSGTSRPRMSKRDMIEGAQRRHPGCTIVGAIKTDNNTLQYRAQENGCTYWALYDTDIVGVHGDRVIVDTGGYNTVTTRARLNDVLRQLDAGAVYTIKGVIYYRWRGVSTPFDRRIGINLDTGLVKPDRKVEVLDKTTKQIAAYMAAWKKKGLPKDSSGDPWIFPDKQGRYDIAPEVMIDWVKGRYVFRNLYAYALRHAGVTPGAVVFFMGGVDRKGGKLDRCDLGRIRRFVRNKLGRG
jgi:hypothetical protein